MTKELAKRQEVEFPALAADPKELAEALQENLGGGSISPFDLDRIGIPAGGGLAWNVPTLDGGEDAEKELLGIVVHVQNARAFWRNPFGSGEGAVPPDCTSDDAVTGVGDPGGACAQCPYAAFGSDSRQRGQACKLVQRLFLLRPGASLPVVVNLPPGSLKNARKYLLRLVSNGKRASSVLTRLTLEKDKNADGIVYSKAVFAMAGELAPPQAESASAYGKALAPYFRRTTVQDFASE